MASNKENQNSNLESESLTKSKKKTDNESQFNKGAIIRIKIKHFLTYSDVVITPGPNLNLILGPNGSGKSTIVCAICLGLGGKPSVLGRAGNIEDYIQYEQEKALIEIDLYVDSTSIIRISREIHKSGTSNWRLNNKSSNLKNIETTIKKLNIQVDNLCQFLPQDRVADFVKMTPQELLANTQKAIGNIEMHERHEQLKEIRKKHISLESNTQMAKQRLESEIEKNKQLENDVKNYHERQKHQDTIMLLNKKRAWVAYSEKRSEFTEKKTQLLELENKYQKSEEDNEPFYRDWKMCEQAEGKIKNDLVESRNRFTSLKKDLQRQRRVIEQYQPKVEAIEGELKGQEQDEKQRENKLLELNHQLRDLEENLNKLPENTDHIQEELSNLQGNVAKLNQEMTRIDNDKNNIKAECGALNQATKRDKDYLAKEQNTYNKKLDLLRESNRDAYQATVWLQQNRHKFRKIVYDPIMLMINVHDPRYAKFIEMQISYRDLVAFIFEDADDLEDFMKTVRDQMKLRVNAAMVPKETLDMFQPEIPIDQFSHYGFENYLKDTFSAPDGVMRYLCKFYNLHRTPVGNDKSNNCVEEILQKTNFHRFYTPDRMYTIKISKYGARNKTTMSVENRPARNLVISTNDRAIQALQVQIQESEESLRVKSNELEELKNTEKEKAQKLEELREKKRELQMKRDYRKNIVAQIDQKKRSITTNERNKIDIEKETKAAGAKIKRIYTERCLALEKYTKFVKGIIEFNKALTVITFKAFILEKKKILSKAKYEAAMSETNDLKEELNNLKEDCARLRNEAKKLMQEAKKISGIAENQNLSQAIKDQFGALPGTLEEIEAEITQEQARLDLMFRVDENVVREFEARKIVIERMENEAANKEETLQTYLGQIEELQNQWLEEANDLMERINVNFSAFFSRLQCVGEVSLKKAENPLDFEKYGICIKVKFRHSEKLQELTASHQSGGEKSVSTVLFMMALQELTSVPFRCVDEINQGMDSKNERKVFEFVVETACRTTSQYFLLTPKLLPELEYSEQMRVHIINNGPEIHLGSSDWDMKAFIRRANRFNN